ncbi:MAG: hypothetical protein QF541_00685 [Lentisphaeria bacterium]|nr:hypothetical protein [Lentisphaeria bacterium]
MNSDFVRLLLRSICGFVLVTTAVAEDKVVAIVNGVELRESMTGIKGLSDAYTPEKRAEMIDQMIEGTIVNEIFHQAAVKAGFDQDEAYLARVNRATASQALSKEMDLARMYELSVEELKAAGDPDAVTAAEIDAELEANPEKYNRLEKFAARYTARQARARKNLRQAYPGWLKTIAADAEVQVDGEIIAADILTATIDHYNGEARPTPGQLDPMWKKLLAIAGLSLPVAAAPDAAADAAALDELELFKQALADVRLTIGKYEARLGDLPQIIGMLNQPQIRPGSQLYTLLRTRIVYNRATVEGFDETPEAKERQARFEPPIGWDRAILTRMFFKRETAKVDDEPLDPAEIEAYRKQNARRFGIMREQPNGEEMVQRRIEDELRSRRRHSYRNELMDELRAAATIERIGND